MDDKEIKDNEEQLKKMQEQKNIESNAKAVKVAAKTVANVYAGPLGGKAIDIASKTALGKGILNAGGKAVNNVTKRGNLGGKALQGVINTANDMGLTDAADKVAGKDGIKGKSGKELLSNTSDEWKKAHGIKKADKSNDNNAKKKEDDSAKTKASDEDINDVNNIDDANNINNGANNNNNNDNNNIKGKNKEEKDKKKKKKLTRILLSIVIGFIVSLAVSVILFFILMGPILGFMLDLTEILYKPTTKTTTVADNSNGSIYNKKLTEAQVNESLLYVGDSRVSDMGTIVGGSTSFLTSSNASYNWLISEGRSQIASKIEDGKIKFVVLALGLYDLQYADQYVNVFNSLQSSYPNVSFYYLSVNPVNESLIKDNKYNISTSRIKTFNNQLSIRLGDKFIDTYSIIGTAFNSKDGIHYDASVYSKIHSYVVNYIRERSSSFKCGGTFTNYYQYNYQESYGYGTTIASAGCGPTAMAMILTYYLQRPISPVETANWSLQHGYRVEGNGTSWSYFPAIAAAYNIQGAEVPLTADSIYDNLNNCKLLIAIMSCCTFTDGGHYIVLVGTDENGKILVADPNSESRSNQSWDVDVFLREGNNLWAFSA